MSVKALCNTDIIASQHQSHTGKELRKTGDTAGLYLVLSAICLFVQLSSFFSYKCEEVLVVLLSVRCLALLHHPGNVEHPVTRVRGTRPRVSMADGVEVVHQAELDDD